MSTYGDGSYNSQAGGERAHMCNCIGCCKKCGMCRTNMDHTPSVCEQMVAINEQRILVLHRERERRLLKGGEANL